MTVEQYFNIQAYKLVKRFPILGDALYIGVKVKVTDKLTNKIIDFGILTHIHLDINTPDNQSISIMSWRFKQSKLYIYPHIIIEPIS